VSDARNDWHEALAATPECIDVMRFGETLTAAEQSHLAGCPRCTSELALFNSFQSDEGSAEETRAAQWIASELHQRLQTQNDNDNVKPFRPRSFSVLYAAAAVLAISIALASWMQMREPSLNPRSSTPAIYRGARIEAIAPAGDVATPPNEMRWSPVADASLYRVTIFEVDRTVVWRGETNAPRIALPPAVIDQFAPGKSLLWEVTAIHGHDVLASSATQRFRVTVTAPRRTR
jgi:hypothetical protein